MKAHRIVRAISGEVTCSCGWTSGHFAHMDDAFDAFDAHEKEAT